MAKTKVTDIRASVNSLHGQSLGNAAENVSYQTEVGAFTHSFPASATDQLFNELSEVLTETIFRTTESDEGSPVEVTEEEMAGISRKVSFADTGAIEGKYYGIEDGQSVDMYTIRRPQVVQTATYGKNTWDDSYTIDLKIKSNQVFINYSQAQNLYNAIGAEYGAKWSSWLKERGRAVLANYILAKTALGAGHVRNLLTEYNSMTKQQLTYGGTIGNSSFWGYVFATIANDAELMKDRNILYTKQISGYTIPRTVPSSRLRLTMLSLQSNVVTGTELATIYNPDKQTALLPKNIRLVPYWQTPADPAKVQGTATTVNAASSAAATTTAATVDNVFAVMHDTYAVAVSKYNYSINNTPLNVAGGYMNMYFHGETRETVDYTEKGIVYRIA